MTLRNFLLRASKVPKFWSSGSYAVSTPEDKGVKGRFCKSRSLDDLLSDSGRAVGGAVQPELALHNSGEEPVYPLLDKPKLDSIDEVWGLNFLTN